MILLKTQKNGLSNLLISMGFTPSETTLRESNNGQEFQILTQSDDIYFTISKPQRFGFQIDSFPDNEVATENGFGEQIYLSWEEVLQYFQKWTIEARNELTQPDLWEDMLRQEQQIEILDDKNWGEEKFTSEERASVVLKLDSFKKDVKDLIQNEDAIKKLEIKMDKCIEMLGSMTKNSWRDQLLGTILSFVLANPAAQTQVGVIFSTLGNALGMTALKLLGK